MEDNDNFLGCLAVFISQETYNSGHLHLIVLTNLTE